MRKFGFTKYRNGIKEVMPKSYQIEEKVQQRRLFFSMINDHLDPSLRVPLHDSSIFEKNLMSIFLDRILSQFQMYKLRPEKAQQVVKIYHHETALFHQFFKQALHPKARYLAQDWKFEQNFQMLLGYHHPVAKLIAMLFDGKEVGVMFDLNVLFAQTVFNRIKRAPGKDVRFDAPYIHIDEKGQRTRLYPQWKHVNPGNISRRTEQINAGFKQLQNEAIDQIYLVYPKTEQFRQHIRIQTKDDYELKMIPYSFTYTNRKEKNG